MGCLLDPTLEGWFVLMLRDIDRRLYRGDPGGFLGAPVHPSRIVPPADRGRSSPPLRFLQEISFAVFPAFRISMERGFFFAKIHQIRKKK